MALILNEGEAIRNNRICTPNYKYGASTTQGLIAAAPKIADALVLTGINFAIQGGVVIEGFAPRVAALQEKRWKGLDAGYVIWADTYANINAFFFKAPMHTKEAPHFSQPC
ncbi:hypothetical protein EG327_004669 [Venturia inaequalis]|uniref:Uncharacterized protein n=1 Tax=Venturia inaequalis TaxID=5025 RepID=A0A8H3V935_VENIN|nr:hypothetical protein EG327_004669 [Venturia inaequalis]